MKKNSEVTTKLWKWLDHNFLGLAAAFLLIFIPLFPKIPLAEVIPGYIVRIRIEDFLILFTLVIWGVQIIRRRVKWHPLITKIILAYLAFGLLSTLSAVFITHTVPMSSIHIAKLYLHYFRRIEYFSLFFIFYSSITRPKQARNIILSLIPVVLAVSIYGFGQKYLYWPVYSTMNREFSKGIKLYLSEHARVPSTFGGHYDAAAYIMMVITILFAIVIFAKNKWLKLASLIAFIAGFWLLILTASRTSFIAYIVAITVLMGLSLLVQKFTWVLPRWLGVMVFSMFIMLSFGDLNERYAQLFGLDKLGDKFKTTLFSAKVAPPPASESQSIDDVTVPSDTPPTPVDPGLPADVYEDIPLEVKVTSSSGEIETKYVSRTYSDNAYKYGLSAAIRFDALWPRAITAFKTNPLLGTGYSTLTKESVGVFTEAESTDNDFLRNLGETGLLGFLTFFGSIIAICLLILTQLHKITDPLLKGFELGFIAATIGLLLNAFYIDVFEASKVAEIFWALAGIALVIPTLSKTKKASPPTKSPQAKAHAQHA